MFYHKLKKEQSLLFSQISSLEKQINHLPVQNLLCAKNGNYTKWYISNGQEPIYLPKKQEPLAQKLAAKKYLKLQLKEFQQQLEAINHCIDQLDTITLNSESLLDSSSCYRDLIQSYFQTFPSKVKQWMTAEYAYNQAHPEHLIHETLKGDFVRSKSEVLIANALFGNNIPYRYECATSLDGIIFYPDFTIMHPQSGKLFYWEHFGMMDQTSYCENAYNKLKIYGANGIIPTINLITTYETRSTPVNSGKIQELIDEYFI